MRAKFRAFIAAALLVCLTARADDPPAPLSPFARYLEALCFGDISLIPLADRTPESWLTDKADSEVKSGYQAYDHALTELREKYPEAYPRLVQAGTQAFREKRRLAARTAISELASEGFGDTGARALIKSLHALLQAQKKEPAKPDTNFAGSRAAAYSMHRNQFAFTNPLGLGTRDPSYIKDYNAEYERQLNSQTNLANIPKLSEAVLKQWLQTEKKKSEAKAKEASIKGYQALSQVPGVELGYFNEGEFRAVDPREFEKWNLTLPADLNGSWQFPDGNRLVIRTGEHTSYQAGIDPSGAQFPAKASSRDYPAQVKARALFLFASSYRALLFDKLESRLKSPSPTNIAIIENQLDRSDLYTRNRIENDAGDFNSNSSWVIDKTRALVEGRHVSEPGFQKIAATAPATRSAIDRKKALQQTVAQLYPRGEIARSANRKKWVRRLATGVLGTLGLITGAANLPPAAQEKIREVIVERLPQKSILETNARGGKATNKNPSEDRTSTPVAKVRSLTRGRPPPSHYVLPDDMDNRSPAYLSTSDTVSILETTNPQQTVDATHPIRIPAPDFRDITLLQVRGPDGPIDWRTHFRFVRAQRGGYLLIPEEKKKFEKLTIEVGFSGETMNYRDFQLERSLVTEEEMERMAAYFETHGFKTMPDALRTAYRVSKDNGTPMKLADLQNVLSGEMLYSDVRENQGFRIPFLWDGNTSIERFLNDSGIGCLQCDGSGEVADGAFTEGLSKSRPGMRLDPRILIVADASGALRSGNLHTDRFLTHGSAGIPIDITPSTLDPRNTTPDSAMPNTAGGRERGRPYNSSNPEMIAAQNGHGSTELPQGAAKSARGREELPANPRTPPKEKMGFTEIFAAAWRNRQEMLARDEVLQSGLDYGGAVREEDSDERRPMLSPYWTLLDGDAHEPPVPLNEREALRLQLALDTLQERAHQRNELVKKLEPLAKELRSAGQRPQDVVFTVSRLVEEYTNGKIDEAKLLNELQKFTKTSFEGTGPVYVWLPLILRNIEGTMADRFEKMRALNSQGHALEYKPFLSVSKPLLDHLDWLANQDWHGVHLDLGLSNRPPCEVALEAMQAS
ncbi:hypothetical protein K2X33_16610 [bacterium]|nr:hypothetical protein [bacterium]